MCCVGEATLIEWKDGDDFCRATVPCGAVEDGKIAQDELDAAIPHGIRWECYIGDGVTPEMIGKELRKRGIWTAEDLADCFEAACQGVRGLQDRVMVRLLRAAPEVGENA